MYTAVTSSAFAFTIPEKSYGLIVQIVLALGLLAYFIFRKKCRSAAENIDIQRVEIKLNEELNPSEIHIKFGQITDLVIHRHKLIPDEELFEIEELEIYEILPAGHATVISLNPEKRGTFPILLGGERPAGNIVVE